jgi:ABC-2 type transport system ATP-binding protein
MMKAGEVVALDRTQNLLSQYSRPTLTVTLSQALPEGLRDRAQVIPGGRYRFLLQNFLEVEGILAALREAGVSVDDLHVGQADLEDVFVAIMKGEGVSR